MFAAEDKIGALGDDYMFVSQEKANWKGQVKQLQSGVLGVKAVYRYILGLGLFLIKEV